jgi:hypothetical protein
MDVLDWYFEKMDGWGRGLERIDSWGWWGWMVGGRVLKGRMKAGCVRKAGEGVVRKVAYIGLHVAKELFNSGLLNASNGFFYVTFMCQKQFLRLDFFLEPMVS